MTKIVQNIEISKSGKNTPENYHKNTPKNSLLLDTLAQLGKTTIVNDKQKLLRKARSKYFTTKLALPLADLKNSREKYYRNSYYCNQIIVQEAKKFTSHYCNTRICNVCNRIRTAKLINGYGVQLRNLDSYFVTVTVPNVTHNELSNSLAEMGKAFTRIQNRLKHSDSKGLKGIRKLEVTYNAISNTYHPHFHIIMDGYDNSNTFVTEWLKEFPLAQPYCQDVTKASESSVIELFKYVTKVVTKINGKLSIYVHAIDVIIEALYKRRTVQPFGGLKMVTEDITELESETYEGLPEYNFIEWVWEDGATDWVNKHGELLTGYEPTEAMKNIKVINKPLLHKA